MSYKASLYKGLERFIM